ncbi:hypothetical protein [Shewanella sp.]|uniref:hypothetical protein n=1 Tax=Shewanella sp. TaxID=50422 RepID=UPI003D1404EB
MGCKICGKDSVNPWTSKEEDVCDSCKKTKSPLMENLNANSIETCKSCGEKINYNNNFCSNCGVKIGSEKPQTKMTTKSKAWYETRGVWFWGGIAAIFLVALFNDTSHTKATNNSSHSSYSQFQSSNDPSDVLVKRCASEAGIPINDPNHAITAEEMTALTNCVDRNM